MTRALLLLAVALAGCAERPTVENTRYWEFDGMGIYDAWTNRWVAVPVAQADPRTEADWPGIYDYRRPHYVFQRKDQFPARNPMWTPDSLTVTNATPRTLLLEQECVVTLAKPGSTQTVALEGSVTIREEASYDE